MSICSNCSTQLVEGSRFCHICGTPVKNQEIICADCGYPYRPGAKFCGKCGSKNNRVADNNPFQQDAFAAGFAKNETVSETSNKDSYSGDKHSTKQKSRNSFEVFQEKIDDLEAEFIAYKNTIGENDAKRYGCPAIDVMIRTISNYIIPDDPDEILQFIRLAAIEIDDIYGRDTYSNKVGIKGEYRYTDITLSHTWLFKMEQAYRKAKCHYYYEPVFMMIDKCFRDKMRKLGKKAFSN